MLEVIDEAQAVRSWQMRWKCGGSARLSVVAEEKERSDVVVVEREIVGVSRMKVL